MKKLLTLGVIIAVAVAGYIYRDRLFSLFSRPANEHCAPDAVWSETERRCISATDTDDTDIPELPAFNMTDIDRVAFVLDDSGKKTISVTRDAGDKWTADFTTEDSPVQGTAVLLDQYLVSNDTTGDIFIPFAINYGGSGSFISIGLFVRQDPTTLILKDSRLIGDRVLIENLSIDTHGTLYTLRITYRDREEGESFAAIPTVLKEMQVTVLAHVFGEATIK